MSCSMVADSQLESTLSESREITPLLSDSMITFFQPSLITKEMSRRHARTSAADTEQAVITLDAPPRMLPEQSRIIAAMHASFVL
ncbi:hypothetical protein V6N13_050973 [Hibiscus sabdariffa]